LARVWSGRNLEKWKPAIFWNEKGMEAPYKFTSFFLVAKIRIIILALKEPISTDFLTGLCVQFHFGFSYHFLLTISDVQVYYRIANDQDTAPQLLTVGRVKTERI